MSAYGTPDHTREAVYHLFAPTSSAESGPAAPNPLETYLSRALKGGFEDLAGPIASVYETIREDAARQLPRYDPTSPETVQRDGPSYRMPQSDAARFASYFSN